MIYYIVAQNNVALYEEYLKPYFDKINKTPILITDDMGNSMFEKYNLGLSHIIHDLKDDDIVCFVHEDIKVLDSYLELKTEMVFNMDKNIGVLGVYGTTQFEEAGGWWLCDRAKYARGHIMQGRPDLSKSFHMTDGHVGYYSNLVSVDGCIFFMNGKLAKSYRFEQDYYDGYHFYDVDACFSAIQQGWKVAVADILVEHASEGAMPEFWHTNKARFIDKWKLKGFMFPITTKQLKLK